MGGNCSPLHPCNQAGQPILLAQLSPNPEDGSVADVGSGAGALPPSPPPFTLAATCQSFPGQDAVSFIQARRADLTRYQQHINTKQAAIDREQDTSTNQEMDPGLMGVSADSIPSLRAEIAEFRLLIWLASRDLGQAQDLNALISNLRQTNTNVRYWKVQIALILVSELDNPAIRDALINGTPNNRILGNGTGWYDTTDPVMRERLALEQIYNQLLTNGSGQPIIELTRFIAENLYRRALIAKRQGNMSQFNTLLAEARTHIEHLATTQDVQDTPVAALKTGRVNYLRVGVRDNAELLRDEFSLANQLMANILMQQINSGTPPQQALTTLQRAETYLRNTHSLDGIPLLEARRVLAQNLLQQGFIQQNQGNDPTLNFSEALCHMDYILDWYSDYQTGLGSGANIQRWLVGIATSTRITRTKLIMVLVGNIDETTSAATLAMLFNDLTAAERQEVEQGVNEARALAIQNRLLEAQAQQLTPTLTLSYQNTTVSVLQPQEQMEVRLSLGESYARRALNARGLHQPYASLTQQARTEFTLILASGSPAAPFTQAMANLWLAKLALADVGESHSYQENTDLLTQAAQHAQAALSSGLLNGALLRSAQLTRNEIRLWRVELTMRHGESYTDQSLQDLETLAFELFNSAPIDSPLIERALRDLIEAYSAREARHERIILMVNILLGRNGQTLGPDAEPALTRLSTATRQLRTRLMHNSQLRLPEPFQAWLYIKLAEATSWSNGDAGLAAADSVLDEVEQNHASVIHPQNGDPQVRTLYLLLRAEIEMRREESSGPVFEAVLIQAVNQSNQVDLIARLTFAQIEGLSYEQDFARTVELIRDKMATTELQRMEQLFGDRHLSYQSYRFRLWKNLTDALKWNNQYQAAVTEMEALLAALPDLASHDQVMANLLRTQIQIDLADIYRYDWSGKNYAQAIANYEAVIARYPNTAGRSPDLIMTIAAAHMGLAEIYRNVPAHQDYDAAREQYDAARQLAENLPADSNNQHLLLAQVYLGLASLDRNESGWWQANLTAVAEQIAQAREHIQQVNNPPAEIVAEIDRIYNDHDINVRIRPEASLTFQLFSGADGRMENQLTIGTHIPLSVIPGLENWSSLHLTLNEQFDLAPETTAATTYLGFQFLPHSSFSFNAQARLGTGGTGTTMQFFRRPDLMLDSFFWSEYATLGAAANFDFSEPQLNSYSASAMLNLAFTEVPFIEGLQFGAEYNSVPFTYGNEFQRMHSVAFGPRLDWNVTDWLSLQGHFMGLAYLNNDYDPITPDTWQMGWQAGAGTQFHINRLLHFDLGFTHQHNNEYPLNMFRSNIQLTF